MARNMAWWLLNLVLFATTNLAHAFQMFSSPQNSGSLVQHMKLNLAKTVPSQRRYERTRNAQVDPKASSLEHTLSCLCDISSPELGAYRSVYPSTTKKMSAPYMLQPRTCLNQGRSEHVDSTMYRHAFLHSLSSA
jgi:hypothetical protein